MISLNQQARLRSELNELANELKQSLIKRILSTPHIHFRQELIDSLEVISPQFDQGVMSIRVRLRPTLAGKWNKAEVAERGFGGSGPSDPNPSIGKEGPYRMNELMLRKHPEGINVKFDLSKVQMSARIQGILESPMFAGQKGAAELRQTHVEKIRKIVFASPESIKAGKGVLQPVSPHSLKVELIGSNISRLGPGNMPIGFRSPSLPEGAPEKAHKHKTDLLHGLMRLERGTLKGAHKGKLEQSQFVIFRRLSSNSAPWVHGGIRGAHILRDWSTFPESRRILRKVDQLRLFYVRSMGGAG